MDMLTVVIAWSMFVMMLVGAIGGWLGLAFSWLLDRIVNTYRSFVGSKLIV